jgi:hypothetical protein
MSKTASRALIELCEGVRQWRKREGGGRGKRVPKALWEQAIVVARVEGVHSTARATRLNYDRLKQRISDADEAVRALGAGEAERATARAGGQRTPEAAGARFIALQVAPGRAGHPTTIELVGHHGHQMRIEVQGEVDLSGLVQAFGSMQP